MHHTVKHSQHSSIIWPVLLNGWVPVYELSGCGFESCCSHLETLFLISFRLSQDYDTISASVERSAYTVDICK